MVSPFGLQASAQRNYSYNDLLLERHFSFSEDISLAKIDYYRGEAGLKHRYSILGHWEQIHIMNIVLRDCRVKRDKKRLKITSGETKNNPQVYTTQEGMQEIKITLRYTLPKRARKIEFTLIYIRRPLFVWTLSFD